MGIASRHRVVGRLCFWISRNLIYVSSKIIEMSAASMATARAVAGVQSTRASNAADRSPVAAPLARRTAGLAAHSQGCFCAQCTRNTRSQRLYAIAKPTASKAEAKAEEMIPTSGSEEKYLTQRVETVQEHFPTATSVADFLYRLEMALCSYGLTGENSIAILNLCRDESTNAVRHKVEELFPLSFNINGLGGGITCGVTGMGAGLSHSPQREGRNRYVFFSFPHIAINSKGELGALSRPGQDATSSACGALIAALGQLKAEGLESNIVKPGVHNADDPEYSILKQRIARRMLKEDVRPDNMNLVDITKIAERQISSDLEYLISKAVDPEKADYAIVTGVQIHNWGEEFEGEEPNIEFIAPTTVSVIVNGMRSDLDLSKMPALSPRMISMLSKAAGEEGVCSYINNSTVSEIGASSMFSAHKNDSIKGNERNKRFKKFMAEEQAKK